MFTDQFISNTNTFLQKQANALIARQRTIATVYYAQKSKALVNSLSKAPLVNNLSVEIDYPIHIRFLDMKKGRGGKKKKSYEPIYNKYVYGYLKSAVYNYLRSGFSKVIATSVSNSLKFGINGTKG